MSVLKQCPFALRVACFQLAAPSARYRSPKTRIVGLFSGAASGSSEAPKSATANCRASFRVISSNRPSVFFRVFPASRHCTIQLHRAPRIRTPSPLHSLSHSIVSDLAF